MVKANRIRKYGLDPVSFDNMFLAQNGKCGVCKVVLLEPAIDHDHLTGKVRGLLCSTCNSGIGLLKDDPAILLEAVNYLLKHKVDGVATINGKTYKS